MNVSYTDHNIIIYINYKIHIKLVSTFNYELLIKMYFCICEIVFSHKYVNL